MSKTIALPWADNPRFAIYAAPPEGSALAEFGRSWLGCGATDGIADDAQIPIPGLSRERWCALTHAPRHYGFHGTLKAPFALAPETSYAELIDALTGFVAGRSAVVAARLMLARIAGFLALVPAADSPALNGLADDCVRHFDGFRRRESPEQIEKRRSGLSPRQSALLDHWGYPYVFEEFRFHMTLTDRLPDDEAATLIDALTPLARPTLLQPLVVEALCLFAQTARDKPFRLIQRFPFRQP